MSSRAPRLRPALIVSLLAFAGLLSCGRDATGPGGRGSRVELSFNPVFPEVRLAGNGEVLSLSDVVDFVKVRVVLVRTNGDTAVDRVVNFPPDSTSIRLAISVTLSQAATSEGEPLEATLKYISATGDTVFTGGPVTVIAKSGGSGSTPPPDIPVVYTGLGANAASIVISPGGLTAITGQLIQYSAQVYDAGDALLAGAPVAFTSTDSNVVRVNLRTGAAQVLGVRGTAQVIAQTLTGQSDAATVDVPPVPNAIVLVSGGNQSVRQGSPFAQPVTVRVNAADALPVAGVRVDFAVTRGQGSTIPLADTTDANGLAQTSWTAGDSAGVGNLRATINGTSLFVVVPGNQLSSAPTSITFESQPATIAAGVSLPTIRLVVRDGTGDTVRTFNGAVGLTLTGGTVGANLIGERPLSAVAGVIDFPALTVDRAGTAYRIVASVSGGPSAQSNTFDVTASAASAIVLVSGDAQSVPPSTALPDSIVVRVLDIFGFGKAGVTVNWTVMQGGGLVSPASSVTDATGRTAARWTAGAGGIQQLRAATGALTPVHVGATVAQAGGPPILFLSTDAIAVPVARARQVTIFLTNPAPTPLTVDLTMRDAIAQWSSAQVVVPQGGTTVTAQVTGIAYGSTMAFASSAAGNDSMIVQVDSVTAVIDGPSTYYTTVSDTISTLVILSEPAPAGGLTVTVTSTDSSSVLVAPGSGTGLQETPCYSCGNDLRAAGPPSTALLAPPAGTATITIPAGQVAGHLVILPIAEPALAGSNVQLLLNAPGYASSGVSINPDPAVLVFYCNYCELGVGQVDDIDIYRNATLRRDLAVHVRSLDPAVATVRDSLLLIPRYDYNVDGVLVIGVDTGTARIEISAPGFVPDTILYTVYPAVILANGSYNLTSSADVDVVTYLGYDTGFGATYGNGVAQPLVVSAVSRDTSIVVPDRAALTVVPGEDYGRFAVRGKGAGSTWVIFSAPGYRSDSSHFTVSPGAVTTSVYSSQIGVGQRGNQVYASASGFYPSNQLRTFTVTSSDPSVLRVLTPSVSSTIGQANVTVEYVGVSVGSASLLMTTPGLDTAIAAMTVVPPVLSLGSFTYAQSIPADGVPTQTYALVGTSGFQQAVADTLVAVLRSTNPAAVQVSDSIVVFLPGQYTSYDGLVRGIAPGTAQLTLSAPGHVPDTSAVITVALPQLAFYAANGSQAGNGTLLSLYVQRVTATTSTLPFTITVQGPSGSSMQAVQDTFPIGTAYRAVTLIAGPNLGTDTLIVSSPGFQTDTMFVPVGRTRAYLGYINDLTSGDDYPYVGGSLRGPDSYTRPTVAQRKFVLASRDTTVLRVLQDTIVFDAGTTNPSVHATIRGGVPGTTWLVMTSTNGSADTDSTYVTVTAPLLYQYDDAVRLGMQEQSYPGEFYVLRGQARPTPLWVKLTSSAPAIVSVPDSVLIPANGYQAYYTVTAGDTVGSAMITLSAAGHSSISVRAFVTRGQINVDWDEYLTAASSVVYSAYAGAGYYQHPLSVDVHLRFVTLDTTIAKPDVDTATIPAGSDEPVDVRVRGRKEGRTSLRVTDSRTGSFQELVTFEAPVDVFPAILEFYGVDRVLVPVGAISDEAVGVNIYQAYVDSSWARVRALGARARVTVDSVLFTYNESYISIAVEGLSAGIDTLVVESAGFRPDTIEVVVGAGALRGSFPITTVRQGDSTQVTVYLASADGEDVRLIAPLSATLTVPPTLQASLGGAPVTTVPVLSGADSFTFWMKGLTPGTGTLTVALPGYAPLSTTILTRSP